MNYEYLILFECALPYESIEEITEYYKENKWDNLEGIYLLNKNLFLDIINGKESDITDEMLRSRLIIIEDKKIATLENILQIRLENFLLFNCYIGYPDRTIERNDTIKNIIYNNRKNIDNFLLIINGFLDKPYIPARSLY